MADVTHSDTDSHTAELGEKKLGLGALVALVIGSMIGGGVFSLPQNFAAVASPGALLAGWVITGIGMLCLAFIYQNLSARCPELDGGIYSYARAGFGDFIGFQAAWGYWFSAWLGNVSYAVLLFSALSFFIPVFGEGNNLISVVGASIVLWLVHALVLRGVREAAWINSLLTIIKVLVLIVFIIAALLAFRMGIFTADFWGRVMQTSNTHSSLFDQTKNTMLVTTWVFIGIEGATVVSARAARRSDIGKATVTGLLGALAIYVLVSVLSMGILDQATLAGLKNPSMAGVLEHVVGPWGARFVAGGVILSVAGALLAWTLFAAELPRVAAQDGIFPAVFARENSRHSPSFSLWITNGLIQVFLLLTLFYQAGYQALFSIATAAILPPYLFSAAYGLKLALTGERYQENERRGGAIALGIIATVYGFWLCYAAGDSMLLSALLFAPGILVYIWQRRIQNRLMFNNAEWWLVIAIVLAAAWTLLLVLQGSLSIA
ncbi:MULTISPECIES: arginine-ornithine antiporter [Mangrovibacter]|uniref:Arginine-ornithine antiporter n=1 Tax=Mangrovibacter plantisponsor TaxID=451513 RepID=A0A317PLL4_9ENTR|nr:MULTISPECIES: arginine-ornithine antiporter [Mangrovibacter]KEA50840.1 amino acid APC transporter [Mangrovibacter sp. MFB070]PWW00997.1 arginine:ornithine antiporter (APA family) [Mangrovibacter plantisponsor]